MKYKDYLDLVPDQKSGKLVAVQASASFKTVVEAEGFYKVAKIRLLNVNQWHQLAGIISAKFQTISPELKEVQRNIQIGDFVRIDIPGPGSSAGDGYDWVHVEEIKEKSEEDIQSIGLQLRPSYNPFGNKEEIAHFYTKEATSNFIITREGNQLSAFIIDPNLNPNQETNSLVDTIRNSVAGVGAIGIFSKIQWQALAEGFMKENE